MEPKVKAGTLADIVRRDVNEPEGAPRRVTLPGAIDFNDWSIEFLIEYIVNIYHASLKRLLPLLNAEAAAFAGNHGAPYPHAPKLAQVLGELSSLLLEHMAKEEDSLFPYLRQISSTHKRRETYGSLFVRTLSKPLDQIKKLEHTHISALLDQLRRLTGNYQFAADAPAAYRQLLQQLRELDADLVQHKHLENHILFPKAMVLEKELLQL
ncbi:hemerythrin domain-containing protein [Paraflavisolibacter sp. H34]|uniref:hemerythrin domain-containing protein n=1 Tax=Huijunlia imazamoxiresistens TaxID=3127457 RepID=UPI0030174085